MPSEIQAPLTDASNTIQWCLISHTNIGKTTLTRTLLGQDVGDVRDAPHVTDSADAHTLVRTSEGDELLLWDTPGFGDSVRLYQRLQKHSNPMGWFLSNVWDRWRDKPFWMSQRAMRAARDNADVVLYLVNASENPADAGYLDAEMHLIQWVGKPVIVLLNQLGTPQTAQAQSQDLAVWRQALRPYQPMVQQVLALDAFTRSWLHEQRLFRVVQPLITPHKQQSYQRIVATWESRNRTRFDASMEKIARMLIDVAQSRETVAEPGGALNLRTLKNAVLSSDSEHRSTPENQAMQALLHDLQRADQRTTEALLRLHQLDGRAAAHIHNQLREYFTIHQPLDSKQMGLIGAITTGAAGGLSADLAAGGLTMGAGALLGALAGAVTFAGAAFGVNKWRSQTEHQVQISDALLDSLLQASLLKYLAIAHFGRGRGTYTDSEAPAHWHDTLVEQTRPHLPELHTLWQRMRENTTTLSSSASTDGRHASNPDQASQSLQKLLTEIALNTLSALYPEESISMPSAAAFR